jgi:hypothetical protein
MTKARKALAVIVGCVLSVGVCAFFVYQYLVSRDPGWRVYERIGSFPTTEAAIRASLKTLSIEIHRYPSNQLFCIAFRADVGGYGSTLYDRKYNTIGFALDPDSGYTTRWTHVDDAAIDAVAATNGTLKNFGNEAYP